MYEIVTIVLKKTQKKKEKTIVFSIKLLLGKQ